MAKSVVHSLGNILKGWLNKPAVRDRPTGIGSKILSNGGQHTAAVAWGELPVFVLGGGGGGGGGGLATGFPILLPDSK